MVKRKPKLPWSKKQLDTLLECWKGSIGRRECLSLVAKRLPEMSPPAALSTIRKMVASDKGWAMVARQKEHEKKERNLTKERQKQARLQRREERQQVQEWRDQRQGIRERLHEGLFQVVREALGEDGGFFFCPKMRQQMDTAVCVFRVFADLGSHGFVPDAECVKCEKMDKHLPVLEEILEADHEEQRPE